MSVVIHVASELLREEDLRLTRDHRLAYRYPGGQDPAAVLPAEDLDLPALVPARRDADVDQVAALVQQQGGERHRNRLPGRGPSGRDGRLDEQAGTPDPKIEDRGWR